MTTRANRDFQLPTDRFTLSTTSSSPLSLVHTSVSVALTELSWRYVMKEEYDALITKNTWDLVPRPVGSNIITGKSIFKHKFNSDNTLECYKAHWVLCDVIQCPDINHDETFSPVVKPSTIRMVLSLTVSRSRPIHQFDVKNVFPHCTLSEIVYCSQSKGFVDPTQPDQVYRLNKSLYGLK
jgi:hypothetical protein